MSAGALARTLDAIADERRRHDVLKAEGRFTFTAYDLALFDNWGLALAVLTEEIGEVARHICDGPGKSRPIDYTAIRVELEQVAAIAVGLAEGLRDLDDAHVAENDERVAQWRAKLPGNTKDVGQRDTPNDR